MADSQEIQAIRMESSRAVLVNRQPINALTAQFEYNLAIVVGINAYAHVPQLKTARPDAERLAGLLADERRDSHDRYEVIPFYDDQASVEALSELLFTTLPTRVRAAGPRTRVLFYFAGHGDAEDVGDGLRGFLFPQNAKPEDEATLLPMGKVQDALTGLVCQHVLLILDCCSAGALPMAQRTRRALHPPPLYWEYLQRYVGRKARQVITSAAHNQQALDISISNYKLGMRDAEGGPGHSPFAQALFEALDPDCVDGHPIREAGQNGVVTATGIYQYISDALYRRVGDMQTPGLWTVSDRGHDQGEFVFLLPGTRLELALAPDLIRREHNPWPGLRAYEVEQKELFFGRDQEIQALAQMIETQSLVAVTGPSAMGKTSLVQAGLLPWLADKTERQSTEKGKPWHVLPLLTLGQTPLDTLNRLLAKHLTETSLLDDSAAPTRNAKALASLVTDWAQMHPDQRLLLALDTQDALFDPVSQEERTLLWSMLAEVAQQDVLHIVLILRSDQWRIADEKQMETKVPLLPTANLFEIGPMNRGSLRQVIEQPAVARMIYLASEKLVDCLVGAVEGEPAALPLLSQTLHRMYLRYADEAGVDLRPHDRTLTQQDYEALGGVDGIAAGLAAEYYNEQTEDDEQNLQRVLMRLVDVKEGQHVRRRAARDEFTYPDWNATACADQIIAGLARQGLVVRGADAQGNPYVELGHTALVGDETRLRKWLVEASKQWDLQRDLTAQVGRWALSQQKADLWDDNARLPQVQEILWATSRKRKGLRGRIDSVWQVLAPQITAPVDAQWLNSAELAFVQASLQARAKFWQRVTTITAIVLIALSLLTTFALVQQNLAVQASEDARAAESTAIANAEEADRQRTSAIAAQETAESEAAVALSRQLAAQSLNRLDTQPSLALLLGLESLHIRDTLEARGSILDGLGSATYLNAVMQNHKNWVMDVAFSPDRKMIVSGDADGVIILWDANTKQPIGSPLNEGGYSVLSLAFTSDGKMLAAGRSDGTINFWNLGQGNMQSAVQYERKEMTESIAFSPNDRLLAAGYYDGAVMVWDIAEQQAVGSLITPHSAPVRSVAFSPDGALLASGGDDNTIILWNVADRQIVDKLTTDATIDSVAFSPDGKHLASAGTDAQITLWDVATRQPIGQPLQGHKSAITSVAYSPDGKKLAAASRDNTIILWDAVKLQPIDNALTGHVGVINRIAFSPDSTQLISGGQDNAVMVWELEPCHALGNPLTRDIGWVNSAAISPDGSILASSGDDQKVRLWNVKDRQPLGDPMTGHQEPVLSVSFSPDGGLLASGDSSGAIILWNVQQHQMLGAPFLGHTNWVNSLAFSPDGQMLASGSYDGRIILWNISTSPQSLEQVLADPWELTLGNGITGVAFSPDGKILASSSDSGNLILWDMATHQQLDSFSTSTSPGEIFDIAISPDGKILASAHKAQTIILWDMNTHQMIGAPLVGHLNQVNSVAFSPDSKILVSGSRDETIILWDVVTHQRIGKPLVSHKAVVNSVTFSSDGNLLVSVGRGDSPIILWDLNIQSWQKRACQIANRNLDQLEWEQFIGPSVPYQCMCPDLPPGEGTSVNQCSSTS